MLSFRDPPACREDPRVAYDCLATFVVVVDMHRTEFKNHKWMIILSRAALAEKTAGPATGSAGSGIRRHKGEEE